VDVPNGIFQWLNRVEAFNKSTGLMLMNMREELRQSDIQWGRNYERALFTASMKAAAEQMVEKGKMTQEQAQELINSFMEEINQSQEKKE